MGRSKLSSIFRGGSKVRRELISGWSRTPQVYVKIEVSWKLVCSLSSGVTLLRYRYSSKTCSLCRKGSTSLVSASIVQLLRHTELHIFKYND